MKKVLDFPDNFLWGASTSSYQVEGGIYNTDWSKAGTEGKVPEVGEGPEHYKRYEDDFDLIKELGHNCHRLSIEWARVEPEEGQFDKKEIEHYKDVLKALKKRGITPFVTLWHFTLPIWLSEKGGIEKKDFPKLFSRYCKFVAKELDGLCIHFATINEPNVVTSNGWLRGNWPPFKKYRLDKIFCVLKQLERAHILAYQEIKKVNVLIEVGIVKDNMYVHADKNPLWKLVARIFRWYWNFYFLNRIQCYVDTIGLNYYFHYHFGKRRTIRNKNDMGWEIYPEGIYHALTELVQYNKPIFVAEAGIADREDKYRAQYIKDLAFWTHKAIQDGAPVKGFMYWSLLDNFEWAEGYEQRFGLVEINYKTKERIVRPSAYEYKKICISNSLVLETSE